MDEPRTTRSRRRARSHSRRHSNRCSRSYSSRESSPMPDHNPKPTQFVPAPMPYYQPKIQSTPMTSNNVNSQPISYMIPQVKQQFVEEKPQLNVRIPFFNKKQNLLFLFI